MRLDSCEQPAEDGQLVNSASRRLLIARPSNRLAPVGNRFSANRAAILNNADIESAAQVIAVHCAW